MTPNECTKLDWSRVVGDKTIEDGGFFGDLLTLSRAHINEALSNGELTESSAGEVFAQALVRSMEQAVMFELGYRKTEAEICAVENETQNKKDLTDTQIAQIKCECDIAQNELSIKEKDVELKERSVNSEIEKNQCVCDIEREKLKSELSLNKAREDKMACDCCNSGKVAEEQAKLYRRQAIGFDDNANQKLFDSQLQAVAMIFGDTNLEEMPTYLDDYSLCETYDRIKSRLTGHIDEQGNFIPGPSTGCGIGDGNNTTPWE